MTEEKKKIVDLNERWARRLMILKSSCEKNGTKCTDLLKNDFTRIVEEIDSKYKEKAKELNDKRLDISIYIPSILREVYDIINIFITTKYYEELTTRYRYIKFTCEETPDAHPFRKVEPLHENYKDILSDRFLYVSYDRMNYIMDLKITLLYSFINHCILSQVKDIENEIIVIDLYQFITCMIGM